MGDQLFIEVKFIPTGKKEVSASALVTYPEQIKTNDIDTDISMITSVLVSRIQDDLRREFLNNGSR